MLLLALLVLLACAGPARAADLTLLDGYDAPGPARFDKVGVRQGRAAARAPRARARAGHLGRRSARSPRRVVRGDTAAGRQVWAAKPSAITCSTTSSSPVSGCWPLKTAGQLQVVVRREAADACGCGMRVAVRPARGDLPARRGAGRAGRARRLARRHDRHRVRDLVHAAAHEQEPVIARAAGCSTIALTRELLAPRAALEEVVVRTSSLGSPRGTRCSPATARRCEAPDERSPAGRSRGRALASRRPDAGERRLGASPASHRRSRWSASC